MREYVPILKICAIGVDMTLKVHVAIVYIVVDLLLIVVD